MEISDPLSEFMQRPSELDDGDDAAAAGSSAAASKASKTAKTSKQRMQAAYDQAKQQQQLRIQECETANKEHGRGKVRAHSMACTRSCVCCESLQLALLLLSSLC
jgi:hypothetical protein